MHFEPSRPDLLRIYLIGIYHSVDMLPLLAHALMIVDHSTSHPAGKD
jgi:hypothetical protein